MGVIIFLTMAYTALCVPVGIIRGILVAFFLRKTYLTTTICCCVLNIVCNILLFQGIFFFPWIDHIDIYNYQCINISLIFLIFIFMLFLDYTFSRIILDEKNIFNTKTFFYRYLYWSCVILPLMFAQSIPDGVTVVNENTVYPKGLKVILIRDGDIFQVQSYKSITDVKQEKINQMIPISFETDIYDKECYIAPYPYGGLIYFSEGRKQRINLNFQTLFYRWSYPQFHYIKDLNVIIFNMKSSGYIFDCNNQKLYAIPSGEIIGIEMLALDINSNLSERVN